MKLKIIISIMAAFALSASAATIYTGGAAGSIETAGDWDNGLPSDTNQGTITSDAGWHANDTSKLVGYHVDVTSGTITKENFSTLLELDGGVWSLNGGSLDVNNTDFDLLDDAVLSIDNASSSLTAGSASVDLRGTSSFTLNAGSFTGTEFEFFDTASFTMNGGTTTLAGNLGSDNFGGGGTGAFLNAGSLSAGTLEFKHAWTLTMGGSTSGSATFTGINDTANTAIDWITGSKMELTIGGYNEAAYETLWNNGKLTIDGSSTGTFADSDFTVTDSTLAIPEPATLGMVAMAGAMLMVFRRRMCK